MIGIENIKNLDKSREKIIKLYNDYAKTIFEAKHKAKYGKGLKIFTPRQMFQRLAMALTQIKPDNNLGNLLNEIKQIIYLLYQYKKIIKENSENSKSSEPHVLILNLTEKIYLQRGQKSIALSNLSYTIHEKT